MFGEDLIIRNKSLRKRESVHDHEITRGLRRHRAPSRYEPWQIYVARILVIGRALSI